MTLKELLKKFLITLKETFPDIILMEEFAEFDVNKEGLDRVEHVREKLVDPEILINFILEQELFDKKGFKDATKHPYPSNAVKALWNIIFRGLQIVEAGRTAALWNSGTHTKYVFDILSYLSANNDYALRVVDDKTLRLARLYFNFINDILKNIESPNFFEGISVPGIKDICKNICSDLSKKLSDIIKKYEARLPNPLDDKLIDHNEIFLLLNHAESSINYFEELHQQNFQPTATNCIPLKGLLDNLRGIDCQSVIRLINEQLSILLSPNRPKCDIIYTPRRNHSPHTEIGYLNGDLPDYVIFLPNRETQEVIPNLQEYLGGMNEFAQRGAVIDAWLANFIDSYLAIKLSQYEIIIEMASALQNSNSRMHFTDEQYRQIILSFTFVADIDAVKQFLTENESVEGTFRVHLVKFRDFLETVKQTDMMRRLEDAEKTLRNHVHVLLASEIERIINTDSQDASSIPQGVDPADQIRVLIGSLLRLKRIKENVQECMVVLQQKYAGCPTHLFDPLKNYLSLKDKEILDTFALLLSFVKKEYELSPLSIAKIETMEQKAEAGRYIAALSAANEQISQILTFVQAQFEHNKDIIANLDTCLQNNKRNIELFTAKINAYGDADSLLDQLQQHQTRKVDLDRLLGRLRSTLKERQERRSAAETTAGILIDIHNRTVQIDQLNRAMDDHERKRPQIDVSRQSHLEIQLRALTSNQSAFSTLLNRLWNSISLLNDDPLTGTNIISEQIRLFQSELASLNAPLQSHAAETERLLQQKSKLEDERRILQEAALCLPPAACEALTVYLSCSSTIDEDTQRDQQNRKESEELEADMSRIQTDLFKKIELLRASLTENNNDLLKLIKNFAIFRLTPPEIISLRMGFDQLLTKVNFNYLTTILQKFAANPVTLAFYQPLNACIIEIKAHIKEFEECYKIHEELALLRHQILDIYDEYFVRNNPNRFVKTKSSAGMLVNNLLQIIERPQGIRPYSPLMNREHPFNKLDLLFRDYLNRTGKYEALKLEIQESLRALLSSDQIVTKEYKASAIGFFDTLFKRLTDIEWKVRELYSRLCNKPTIRPLMLASEEAILRIPMDEVMFASTHTLIAATDLTILSHPPGQKRP